MQTGLHLCGSICTCVPILMLGLLQKGHLLFEEVGLLLRRWDYLLVMEVDYLLLSIELYFYCIVKYLCNCYYHVYLLCVDIKCLTTCYMCIFI